jgi:Ser/Thr protein kinase RdoA (MazF antagonist)
MLHAILCMQRVSNLEKENDLLKQQNMVQEKLTELAKREAEVYRVAFEKEKELTDRALKLAEVGKPKSNWELQGLLGLAAFALGLLAGK